MDYESLSSSATKAGAGEASRSERRGALLRLTTSLTVALVTCGQESPPDPFLRQTCYASRTTSELRVM
jgi:hypothetical protein